MAETRPGPPDGRTVRARRAVLGVVGAVALTAGALTATALTARDEPAPGASRASAGATPDPAVAEALDRRAAADARLREDARAARTAAVQALADTAWRDASAAAVAELASARTVLDGSAGQADEDLRTSLSTAMDAVGTALAGPRGEVGAAAVGQAVGALRSAAGAVTAAQEQWAADRAAATAEAGAASGAPAGWTGGAGPDCGSAAVYQPPDPDVTPFYTSTPTAEGDGSNGRVPRSAMAPLAWCVDARGNQQWLRADAAAAMTSLNEAFRAVFGENIAIDLSYRSYEDQVAMREYYGGQAAAPGTSNHGLGTAVDTWEWDAYAFGSDRYAWLVANGPSYGWVAPDWARADGANPEYWHFEYAG